MRTSWILVALLLVATLALQPAPAQAEYPEKSSIEMYDLFGSLVDCLDIGRCNAVACPALLYLSNRAGRCTPVEVFEPGKNRTTCTFTNFNFSFFAPNTKKVELDLTCSRWGTPWFWFGSFDSPPPGSCAVESTQRRIDQYGFNFTANEAYTTATYSPGLKCKDGFPTSDIDLENFDGLSRLQRHPK